MRKENAFEGIVPRELFFKAQEIIEANRKKFRFTDESMLEQMGAVLDEQGRISARLLLKLKKTPHPKTFRVRFGSLGAAYRRIGFTPRRDCRHLEITSRLSKISREIIDGIISQIQRLGVDASWDGIHHTLLINHELRVRVVFVRHNPTFYGTSRWVLRWRSAAAKPDVTMAVRMDPENEHILDYYLLPGMETIPRPCNWPGGVDFWAPTGLRRSTFWWAWPPGSN